MELRRHVDPFAWGPDKRVFLAHPESEGYAVRPGPAGWRVTCRDLKVGIFPDLEAAKAAAFRHRREAAATSPGQAGLFGPTAPEVPARHLPAHAPPAAVAFPPFVPAEEAWMYPTDEDEANRTS